MAGNLTRINNNQITDASGANAQLGINANTKVQDYSVTSAKLANNFTYGNNFTITGNLQVNGNTTTIDTTTLTVEDPLILLASGQTATPTVDIGFIGERGTANNIAFVWDESIGEFATVFTDSLATDTTVNILSYASFTTNNANIIGNLTVGGNLSLTGNIASLTVTGNITGGNVFSNGIITSSGTVTGGNISTAGFVTATGNITGENVFANTAISAVGTVTGGNVRSNGTLSATGDITTAGNISAAGTIAATNTISGGNISTAGTVTAATVTATGTITGGNITTGGYVCATGNVAGNNVNVTTDLSAGGNILTAGFVSATGNVTGNYFIGNGSQLTDLPAGSFLANGTSNVNIATADGNITMGVAGTADVVTVSATAFSVNGNVFGAIFSASGNITSGGNVDGGNILTNNTVSAGGNVTGGNIISGGFADITGNIAGGNLRTVGQVTATGNITGGNIATAGEISATGNTTVGNMLTGGLVSATGNINSAANINGGNLNATTSVTSVDMSASGNIIVNANVSAGNVLTSVVTTTGNASLTLYGNTGLTLSTAGNISASSVNIIDLANPVNDQDAATKFYVDSVAQGLNIKAAVLAATTGNIDLVGTQTIDGVAVPADARVLVKNQDTPADNGIYIASLAPWQRSADADTWDELVSAFVFVQTGNVNADTGYVCTIDAGGTLGTTPVTWTQFSGAGAFQAGNGLTLTGTTFSVNTDNITTTITSGNVVVKTSANLTTPNIGNATFQSLSAVGGTGNIIANNISVSGNIATTEFVANGNVSVTGYVVSSNVIVTSLANTTVPFANATGGLLSNAAFTFASGVLNVGNVSTTGTITADGNITAANFTTTGGSGNITGANIITANTLSASGNIFATRVSVNGNVIANFFIGDGSQLANLSAGSQLLNGNSNVTVAANSNVSFTVNSVANIVVVSNAGITTSGNVSATGHVDAGNVNVSGNIATTSVLITSTSVSALGAVRATDVYTTNLTATGTIQGGNVVTANVSISNVAVSALGNITTANFFIGDGSQLANVVANVSTVANGTSNLSINTANGNITMAVNGTANVVVVNASGIVVTADISATGSVSATGNVTTANAIVGSTANIVNNALVGSLSVTGDIFGGNVFFVDTSTNTASFGNSTQTTNAIVAFNATNSILLPVGNTIQRPATGVTGMVRWNTTEGALEAYDGVEWATVGAQQFTVIDNEQFAGDGTDVTFTLATAQTTDSCIVTINGVVQIPTTAYSVSGTTLTFTEAPAIGDTIDVRTITTTTTVTGLTAANISLTGNIVAALGNTPTTALTNSSLTFSLASDTALIVSVKGTDGTVRSATITLA